MSNDQHIASAFDRDLETIQAQIMKMGGLVEQAILNAAKSLETRDEELAEDVRNRDRAIDQLEEQINEEAARVIHDKFDLGGDEPAVVYAGTGR